MSTKTTKDSKNSPVRENAENVMYIGPNVSGLIRHSTVFQDGILPENVKKKIAEFPIMGRLFIPLSNLPAVFKELRKENSAVKTICAQVEEYFKKEEQ